MAGIRPLNIIEEAVTESNSLPYGLEAGKSAQNAYIESFNSQ